MSPGENDEDLEFIRECHRQRLSHRQLVDYNRFRADFDEWLRTEGKKPDRERGHAADTADNYSSRVDQILRLFWDQDGYTTAPTREQADQYAEQLATDDIRTQKGEPYAESTKRRHTDALVKFFQYRAIRHGGKEWDPPVNFSAQTHNHADDLSETERRKVRQAALTLDDIPNYDDLTPEARDRWRAYLAQKLGRPKSEIKPVHWEQVNESWEIPSLVWTALDAGLRPIEVERSTVHWLRLEKSALFIPKEDSSKNRDNWEVALSPRTTDSLERWLEERETYPKYDDTDAIWLNREGNPHSSGTLNRIFDKLCEEAGIDRTNRKLTWYSIRHSVGTQMTGHGSLAETKEQLRHKNIQSTMQYVHPSTEKRQETLDKMG
jgi:site-specific recombinase XerD